VQRLTRSGFGTDCLISVDFGAAGCYGGTSVSVGAKSEGGDRGYKKHKQSGSVRGQKGGFEQECAVASGVAELLIRASG
jgi:hypothetical protein